MKRLTVAVLGAFVLGFVLGAVGGIGFGGELGSTNAGPNPDAPPYSVSKSSGNCLDVRPNSGWVHEVAVGESFAVTLNATVVHAGGQSISANVNPLTTGVYRIDLRTVSEETRTSDSGRTKSPPADCRVATDVRFATSLPTDYRQFEVTLDGQTLLTVENEDTVPDLYQLPNPMNATASTE